VQGVGYRNYVQRRAEHLGLSGFVTNLKDGRVQEFVRELEKGPPLSRVEKVTVRWLPPTGRFASFGIRFAEFEP